MTAAAVEQPKALLDRWHRKVECGADASVSRRGERREHALPITAAHVTGRVLPLLAVCPWRRQCRPLWLFAGHDVNERQLIVRAPPSGRVEQLNVVALLVATAASTALKDGWSNRC